MTADAVTPPQDAVPVPAAQRSAFVLERHSGDLGTHPFVSGPGRWQASAPAARAPAA